MYIFLTLPLLKLQYNVNALYFGLLYFLSSATDRCPWKHTFNQC